MLFSEYQDSTPKTEPTLETKRPLQRTGLRVHLLNTSDRQIIHFLAIVTRNLPLQSSSDVRNVLKALKKMGSSTDAYVKSGENSHLGGFPCRPRIDLRQLLSNPCVPENSAENETAVLHFQSVIGGIFFDLCPFHGAKR